MEGAGRRSRSGEYYLNERQMKAIQKELGEMDEGGNEIVRAVRAEDRAPACRREAREKANGELNKLKMDVPMSAEATVVRKLHRPGS